MKIVADKNIPFLKGIAEKFGDVSYIAGNEFNKDAIRDADTLIVRTVTYFGKDILEDTRVKLICSATIGYDHIDTEYCDENGIEWHNAPGCNSGSVMQYVVSSLLVLSQRKGFRLQDMTIGIVGVGNVGKKVARACRLLGMNVLLNDPLREEAEGSAGFVDLETIKRQSDIITFHTPLTKEGKFKTLHLADGHFFETLGKKPVIINSARGGIIDTGAIKDAIANKQISGSIIDCWEKEPDIDTQYMNMVDIATPHIAGYSADGKANATRMSLESIARFWNLPADPVQAVVAPEIPSPEIDLYATEISSQLVEAILRTYNPMNDHQAFTEDPSAFSALRGNYPLRREYAAYLVSNANEAVREVLENLGFKIINS